MKVYIIIVNFNGWQDTIECLESVFMLDYDSFRVVVCDNGSADGSLERIQKWAETGEGFFSRGDKTIRDLTKSPVSKPISCEIYSRDEASASRGGTESRLTLIDCGENLGFGGGNNVGLRYAMSHDEFTYAWLLNNDTVVTSNALTKLVARMDENPGAGMCGSTLLLYDSPLRVQAFGGGYYCKWIGLPWHIGRFKTIKGNIVRARSERWMNYVVGASLLVSKRFLQTVGLMAEEYFLYFEELDWALRAKNLFTLSYAPESVVYHKVGASIGTSSNPVTKSLICDYYNIRNRIFFTRKYYPYAMPAIYATLLVAILARVLCGKWGRVAMIWQLLMDGAISPSRHVKL